MVTHVDAEKLLEHVAVVVLLLRCLVEVGYLGRAARERAEPDLAHFGDERRDPLTFFGHLLMQFRLALICNNHSISGLSTADLVVVRSNLNSRLFRDHLDFPLRRPDALRAGRVSHGGLAPQPLVRPQLGHRRPQRGAAKVGGGRRRRRRRQLRAGDVCHATHTEGRGDLPRLPGPLRRHRARRAPRRPAEDVQGTRVNVRRWHSNSQSNEYVVAIKTHRKDKERSSHSR